MSIRVGIIGAGVVAQNHLKALQAQSEISVVGIADKAAERAVQLAQDFGTRSFDGPEALLSESKPDYVLVCTPHYLHMPIAMAAMRQGVHALVEKPMAVLASDVDAAIQVSRNTGCLLGVSYNMRPRPERQKMMELIRSGFLGRLIRVTLVDTEWFRTMSYYRSSPWRATWKGEGGGILVNQAPHDLDLLIGAVGLPCAVQAWLAATGHAIEVDDTLCAILRWPDGAVGTVHVNTNEYPGHAFLELVGTKGNLRLEQNRLTALSLTVDAREFSDTVADAKSRPGLNPPTVYELPPGPNRYLLMHQNFVEAFVHKRPLFCPAEEGLKEVELANALMIAGITQRPVTLPVDRLTADAVLDALCQTPNIEAVQRQFGAPGPNAG